MIGLVNCDSILQHLCQTFDFACTESNEPVHLYSMTVKPSYTAPFEIVTLDISLTWEMVFQKVAGVVRGLRYMYMYLKR